MDRLDKTSASYGMEISAEKTTLMTNNTNGIIEEISANGRKLETVSTLKYLGLIVPNEGPKPAVISRIAQTYRSTDKTETDMEG